MRAVVHRHDRTDEGDPDKEEAGELFRDGDSGIKSVPQDHVAEYHHDHGGQHHGKQRLNGLEYALHSEMTLPGLSRFSGSSAPFRTRMSAISVSLRAWPSHFFFIVPMP